MTTVFTNIGRLVTNGADGPLSDAYLVSDGDHIVEIGTGRPPDGDERVDVAGRCVIPGFVDSHSHMVFAGERSEELAARMAGAAYEAGGISATIDATRGATDDELAVNARRLVAEARRSGTTTVEIKSGYGATVADEVRSLDVAGRLTAETTFLGAHVVPPEYARRPDDYVALVTGDMLTACRGRARWADVFCETGAFDADQSRAVLSAAAEAGLGLRIHANQLGHGPGVLLGVELGCASADHCTYLDDDDIEALAASDTVATFLPATDFSTRQPYPNARRALDAGVTTALSPNCNPGSSFTTSMPFVIALAVRDLGMTIDEAIAAATAGGARALRRDDIGTLGAGLRADLTVLDAPHESYLVYRPGVPLIAATYVGGTATATGHPVDSLRRSAIR